MTRPSTDAPPAYDHARATYDVLAPHYDVFTASHDYDDWTATIERLAQSHGLAGHRLLDIACGTGKSFLPFLRRGYAVTACDVAPNMVQAARRKAAAAAALIAATGKTPVEPPRVEVADLRALPSFGTFDLVTCLDDVINHLTTSEELGAAFRGVRRNLAPGGLAVFDLNTLHAYREAFSALHVVPAADRVVVCDGRATAQLAEGGSATATFETFERDGEGRWRRSTALHHQRHHSRHTIEAALQGAGLEVVAVYGMSWDGATTEGVDELTNSKALYIAQRAVTAGPGAHEEERR